MADMNKRGPADCEDVEGERGERGKRGKRGKRGHRGHDGHDGNEGATGPTGPAGSEIPLTSIVIRPGDPLGSHDNVFLTWEEAYAAIAPFRDRGTIQIEFDDRFVSPVPIPAGVWDIEDLLLTHAPVALYTEVEILDGCQFTPEFIDVRIRGYGFKILCNRTTPGPAPFNNQGIVITGNNVRLMNTDPAALPMIAGNPFFAAMVLSGEQQRGGLGDDPRLGTGPFVGIAAPLVDIVGGFFFVAGGGGIIGNNAFTDSVGGGVLEIELSSESCVGDFVDQWDFPGVTAGGGAVLVDFTTNVSRAVVDPFLAGTPVTAGISPYQASYNEIVFVDSSSGPVTVIAPSAAPSSAERLIIKDVGNNAATNPITLLPFPGGDAIEIGTDVINTNGGSRTWMCDGNFFAPGPGTWWEVK